MVERKLEVYAVSCKTPESGEGLNKILTAFEEVNPGSLICFPEYFLDGQPQYSGIETTDELFVRLIDFARERNLNFALGVVEKEGDERFVSGIFISQEGEILGKQRKINLVGFEEKAGISAGKPPRKIIETDFGTVAFSICRDQWSYDPTLRAEINIHPRAFGLNDPRFGRFFDNWLLLDRVTAMLNKAYLIGVTAPVGEAPLSDIISFEGEILAMREDQGVIQATLYLDLLRKYRNKKYISRVLPKF